MSPFRSSLRDSIITCIVITILFTLLSHFLMPQSAIKLRQIFPLTVCIAIVVVCIGLPISLYVRRNLKPERNRRNFLWYAFLGASSSFLIIFIPVMGFSGLSSTSRIDWLVFIICFTTAGTIMGGLSILNNKERNPIADNTQSNQ